MHEVEIVKVARGIKFSLCNAYKDIPLIKNITLFSYHNCYLCTSYLWIIRTNVDIDY